MEVTGVSETVAAKENRLRTVLRDVAPIAARYGFLQKIIGKVCEERALWEEALRIVADIEAAGEPLAVHSLFPVVLFGKPQVSEAAEAAIAALLGRVPPALLARLDEAARSRSGYLHDFWPNLDSVVMGKLAGRKHATALLGVASFHPSGYVREEAVKLLAARPDAGGFGFLLVRCNDWVSQIRTIAVAAVLARLQPGWSAEVVRHLPLVLRLEECGRGERARIVEATAALLADSECVGALRSGLSDSQSVVRHACARLVQRMKGETSRELMREVFRSPDPILRFRAAQVLLSESPPSELRSIWVECLKDAYMPVRRVGLEAALKASPDHARSNLEAALFDRNRSMRELARFHLARMGVRDFGGLYRARIATAEGPALALALRGLGETGTAADFGLVRSYLEGCADFVRCAALFASSTLAVEQARPYLLLALKSESASLSRVAQRSLAAYPELWGDEEIREIYRTGLRLHVRRNALRVLFRGSKWEKLLSLAEAAADLDPAIAKLARVEFTRWDAAINRSFIEPTPTQKASARRLIETISTRLPEELNAALRILLNGG